MLQIYLLGVQSIKKHGKIAEIPAILHIFGPFNSNKLTYENPLYIKYANIIENALREICNKKIQLFFFSNLI